VFWIRRDVEEPRLWREQKAETPVARRALLSGDVLRHGALATTMNACAMFGYWGLFTWIPAYLSLPVSEGGRGLDLTKTTAWLLVMGVGKWLGYASFGFFGDAYGRRRSYVAYLLVAALLVPLYGLATTPLTLLLLGPFVAFFGTGFFSGFSAIASELFPTPVRASAMGLSYNLGRGLSAAAPFVVGALAREHGLGAAFLLQAAAFFVAALLALMLPETKGRALA
jgi:predicted MFS family arabinose efflux permease